MEPTPPPSPPALPLMDVDHGAAAMARIEDALLAFLASLGHESGPVRLLGKSLTGAPDQILRWLQLLRMFHANLLAGRMVSQRDVYYSAPHSMFGAQVDSNREIRALSNALGLTRLQMGVYASSRGCVVGRLLIRDATGAWIDCSALGKEGKSIAGDLSDLGRDMECDARFMVVVEKQGVFDELCSDGLPARLACVMVTASGVPDLATRAFVSHVSRRFALPVYGVADWNAGGVIALATYRFGSVAGGLLDGADHPCATLRWTGLLWDDVRTAMERRIENNDVDTVVAPMSASDRARVNNVRHSARLQGAAVQQQLALMEHNDVRMELQALRGKGATITEWLAHKIVTRSYVEF